ncbi:MAG: Lar family restriction alleviation protein [Rhodobacteraceae bacterium]|nr:Lar family restriction alleviation protein [Paracoccaceae bacterium]
MTDTPNTPELLPCPFCGGDAELQVPENDDVKLAIVMCMKCYSVGSEQFTDNQAITAWNTRTPPQAPDDQAQLKALNSQEVSRFLDSWVLQHIVEMTPDEEFGWGFPFAAFTNEYLSRDLIRATCRSLTDRGHTVFMNSLFTDDGMVAGSGYGITKKGRGYFTALSETSEPTPPGTPSEPNPAEAAQVLLSVDAHLDERIAPAIKSYFIATFGKQALNIFYCRELVRIALRALTQEAKSDD